MDFSEFITKVESFFLRYQEKVSQEEDDESEILFSSTYRRVFIIKSKSSSGAKIMIEVRATLPMILPKNPDQQFYSDQISNMIALFTYLRKLQSNGFVIDALPEGIWNACMELLDKYIEEKIFNLLNLSEEIL